MVTPPGAAPGPNPGPRYGGGRAGTPSTFPSPGFPAVPGRRRWVPMSFPGATKNARVQYPGDTVTLYIYRSMSLSTQMINLLVLNLRYNWDSIARTLDSHQGRCLDPGGPIEF